MKDITIAEGIINRNGILWIHFRFKGVKCRESLKLEVSPKNIKIAERKRSRILDEINEGSFNYENHFPESKRVGVFGGIVRKDVLVMDQMTNWLKGHENFIAHSTHNTYLKYLNRHIGPKLGKKALADITKNDIKAFISQLVDENLSRKSIADILIPLRQMFNDAQDNHLIKITPFVGKMPLRNLRTNEKKKESDDIDPFSFNEIQLILQAFDGQLLNFFQFALGTGMRTSELIELRWDDVDWQDQFIKVRRAKVMGEIKETKTRAGARDIPILPLAMDALKAQKAYTYLADLNGERYIFHHPQHHRPWASDKAPRESFWRPQLRLIGVRYRYPYQCRHTLISHMAAWNEPITMIAELAGHSSAEMIFRRYAKWMKGGPSEHRYWTMTRNALLLGRGHNLDTKNY